MAAKYLYRKSDGRFLEGGFYDPQPPMVGDPPTPDFVNYGVAEFADADLPSPTDVFDAELGKRPMTPEELAIHFPPPPTKTRLSHADVLTLLSPAEWAEMNKFHPAAEGQSISGTPYNDALVFWAVSIFQQSAHIDMTETRFASIMNMLELKGILSTERKAELLIQMAQVAAAKP